MVSPDRGYTRNSDVGAEGNIVIPKGDQMDREIANIREWMKDVDDKVDVLIKDGCSHRGNDLAKLARIELATDGFRVEAGAIKDSIYQLSLSFEQHKTKVVESNNTMDNKISNLKLGILVQCILLMLVIMGFIFKEFVIPATKNPMYYSSPVGAPHVVVSVEEYNRMMDGKK